MYRLLFACDFLHVLSSRSYVSGLLLDTRVVTLLVLRTLLGLISCKVDGDHMGRQTLGAYYSVPCSAILYQEVSYCLIDRRIGNPVEQSEYSTTSLNSIVSGLEPAALYGLISSQHNGSNEL